MNKANDGASMKIEDSCVHMYCAYNGMNATRRHRYVTAIKKKENQFLVARRTHSWLTLVFFFCFFYFYFQSPNFSNTHPFAAIQFH